MREEFALSFKFMSLRSNRIIVYNKYNKQLNMLIKKVMFFIQFILNHFFAYNKLCSSSIIIIFSYNEYS